MKVCPNPNFRATQNKIHDRSNLLTAARQNNRSSRKFIFNKFHFVFVEAEEYCIISMCETRS